MQHPKEKSSDNQAENCKTPDGMQVFFDNITVM